MTAIEEDLLDQFDNNSVISLVKRQKQLRYLPMTTCFCWQPNSTKVSKGKRGFQNLIEVSTKFMADMKPFKYQTGAGYSDYD